MRSGFWPLVLILVILVPLAILVSGSSQLPSTLAQIGSVAIAWIMSVAFCLERIFTGRDEARKRLELPPDYEKLPRPPGVFDKDPPVT